MFYKMCILVKIRALYKFSSELQLLLSSSHYKTTYNVNIYSYLFLLFYTSRTPFFSLNITK